MPDTVFIVVRHGETRWNVEARIQGQRDSPLTENGIVQAEALADRLAAERIDALVSSDLGRALATARRIGDRIGLDVVPDARFRERSFGAGEGLTYADVDEAYPGAFARILAQKANLDPDKWQDVRLVLGKLADPESFQSLKHGYARGFEAQQLVDNIRNYYDILTRMEPREPAPLSAALEAQASSNRSPGAR